MIFTAWIGQRHMTAIYGMRPFKLDEDMLLDTIWCIAKATKLIKNKTRKRRKKILPIKNKRNKVATLAAVGHDNFSFVFVF